MTTKNALELQNISIEREGRLLLDDVSLTVPKGQFTAIIGPNGGGKTTLLKLIMGLLSPTKGSLKVLGLSPKNARKNLGYVPQHLRFDKAFPLTVRDMVLMGKLRSLTPWRCFTKEDKQKSEELLELMGLGNFSSSPVGSLSGGQLQRALIARALLSDPEMLLLDEPTANIDSASESILYDCLEKKKEKMTILMVTHDLQAIDKKIDKVLYIQSKIFNLLPKEVCSHYAMGVYHPPGQHK